MSSPNHTHLVVSTGVGYAGAGHGNIGVVIIPLSLDKVVPHLRVHCVVEGQAGVGLAGLWRGGGHLTVIPERVPGHISSVSLVDNQAIDAIIVGLVEGEDHPAVEVGVLIPGDVDT